VKDLESFGVSVKLGYKEMMLVDELQKLIEEETREKISAGKILRALIKEGLKNSQAVREELENDL
jgi:hypothetical protein